MWTPPWQGVFLSRCVIGWPPAIGLQERVANHRKRRWSKAKVVSVTEKALQRRPFDLTDRDAVLRQCAVLLAGARAEAIWRRQRGLPMPIASDSGYDRRSIREMCERGGYDAPEIEAEAWQMLAD